MLNKTKTIVPFFSVVITVYNKSNYILSTINSVLNQRFEDFELIIVNDGSTDGSDKIINSIKDNRIKVITIKNQGASIARNTGIKAAKAEYIALLDGDDLWKVDYLHFIKNAINNYPKHKIFTTAIAQKYSKKIVPVVYNFEQKSLYGIHNYFKSSAKYTLLTSSSVVFHKPIIKKTGDFDPTIVSGQDTDQWVRFGLYYDIVFINKQLVLYNHVSSSLSNSAYELRKKPKFNKYLEEEKKHPLLKAHIDRNRYAMAILSKVVNDKKSFLYYTSFIDSKNLNKKQKLLLNCPRWILKLFIKLKSIRNQKLYYPKV